MATGHTSNSELLLCPICSQEYKKPKFLSCGHTVCLNPCLQNILQNESPSCPVCKTEIQSTSSSNAEDFPPNHALEAVLRRSQINLESSPIAGKENKPLKRKLCEPHEEVLDKFCETCSEVICEKCVTESHELLHEITSITEAAEKQLQRLEAIDEDIDSANERLDKLSEVIKTAQLKCHTDADSIKMEVKEAGTWATDLINNWVVDLSSKIDERKEQCLKEIQNIESQNLETILFSSYLKNVCESLKHDQQSYSVTYKGVVDNVSRKTEKLLQDILKLEKESVTDNGIGLKFRAASSSNVQENRLGTLELNTCNKNSYISTCNMWPISKIEDIHSNSDGTGGRYAGFTWVGKGSWKGQNLCIIKCVGRGYYITQSENCLHICDELSAISPCTDFSGLSVLGHSLTSVYKISVDPSGQKPDKIAGKIKCLGKMRINAVCWDENRSDCYALLNDGISIVRVNFSGLVGRDITVKLGEPVVSVTSRQFHVSELCKMAICEKTFKRVRYYDSVKAKVTKIVTAPPDINGWYPVFVISRKYDQSWFVAWEHSVTKLKRVEFLMQEYIITMKILI